MDSLNTSFSSEEYVDDAVYDAWSDDATYEEYVASWPRPQRGPRPPAKLIWAPPIKKPTPLSPGILKSYETYKEELAASSEKKAVLEAALAALSIKIGESDSTPVSKWSTGRNTIKQNLVKRLLAEQDEIAKKKEAAEKHHTSLITASTVTMNMVESHKSYVEFIEEYEKIKAAW